MGVDRDDTNVQLITSYDTNDLLVGIRNVTCEGGETQIWTFGQDDRSFETFLPYVGLLGLQLNKKSRF